MLDFLLDLEGAFGEASSLLEMPLPTDRSHEDILAEARAQLLEVSLRNAVALELAQDHADHRESIPADQALRDPESGLVGAAGFNKYLTAEVVSRTERSVPRALGLLLIGLLDPAEDDARCATVGGLLEEITRHDDFVARVGGGRYAVLVPHCTPFGLRALADRVRRRLAEEGIAVGIGGACLGQALRARDGDALMAVCDRYLEKACSDGKGRCCLHASVIRPRG